MFWVAGAWAGEAELAVERGWVAWEQERFVEARRAAREVLTRDPAHAGARELYVQASAACGWGSTGALELVGTAAEPPWAAETAALADGLGAGDKPALKAAVAALQTRFPDEPDLLVPLWSAEAGPAVALRARWAIGARPATWSEEALLRWRRRAAGVEAASLQAAVTTALADRPGLVPPRGPLDHYALRALGQTWSEQPPADVWLLPSEVPVAGGHLDELWTKAGRWGELTAFWGTVSAAFPADPSPHEHAARAWLAAQDRPAAERAVGEAFGRLGAPRESDATALGADRQRGEAAAVLHTRAALEAEADPVSARGDLGTAYVLVETPVDPPLADRLEHLAPALEMGLEPKYRSKTQTAAQLAVGRALTLPAADTEQRLALAREARFLALTGSGTGKPLVTDPEAWAEILGDTWFVEGLAHGQAGRDAEARAALVVATLLNPADGEAWERRAAAHEKLRETSAAFAALAMARGRGVPALDTRLQAAYEGPGDWLAVARALGGDPPATPPPARVRGTPGPPKGSGGGTSPRLNQPFPLSKLGDVSLADHRGRIVVISAYQSGCAECLQALPAYALLASRLRRQAVDLVLVPLNTDTDEDEYLRTAGVADSWGQLAHDPALGKALAIRRYPTTWVVDRTGVTRFYVDHWLSAQELEALIRQTP